MRWMRGNVGLTILRALIESVLNHNPCLLIFSCKVVALLYIGKEHGNTYALACGFPLEERFLAFRDVAAFT